LAQGYWHKRLTAGIAAASEATFPENDLGAPDWKSTEMVRRTFEYLDELPPPQQRLVKALFLFVELAAIVLAGRFRRFSKLPVKTRTGVIRRWRASRWLAFRVLGDAVKATTTMIYMSHPSVIRYIEEYRCCARPLDPLEIPLRELPAPQELGA
jgi:hypothetical protein